MVPISSRVGTRANHPYATHQADWTSWTAAMGRRVGLREASLSGTARTLSAVRCDHRLGGFLVDSPKHRAARQA